MKDVDYLVEYAKRQVGRPYWGGTYGQIADETLLTYKRKQYPELYPDPGSPSFKSQFGQKVHDCNGLVFAASVCDTPDSKPNHYPSPYYGVSRLYKECEDTGSIYPKTKLVKGELLFRNNNGHVGIYGGDGYVYHAKGHRWGVLKEPYRWTEWINHGKFTQMYAYPSSVKTVTVTVTLPFLQNGSKADSVKVWQQILSINKFNIGSAGIDGDFGKDTTQATKDFQTSRQIKSDGQVGTETWTEGLNSLAPKP